MKTKTIIYWVSTVLFSLLMLFIAFNYFTNPEMEAGFKHLGFPAFFRIELGVLKVLGVVVLVLPMAPYRVKLLAYFGFTLAFITAFMAHLSVGDPLLVIILPVLYLGLLAVSYRYSPATKS